MKPWEEGSIADVFGLLDVAKPLVVSRALAPKAHVLVCAPSNSALDEIVIRLLNSGILDRHAVCLLLTPLPLQASTVSSQVQRADIANCEGTGSREDPKKVVNFHLIPPYVLHQQVPMDGSVLNFSLWLVRLHMHGLRVLLL